jgi:hypothetical protein
MVAYFKPSANYALQINERQFERAKYEEIDLQAQWDVLGLVVRFRIRVEVSVIGLSLGLGLR